MKKYQCGLMVFDSLDLAIQYANTMHKVTGIILGIQEV